MELYILRHAIAIPRGTPGYPDDDRPLTEDGIIKMKRAAVGIAHLIPSLDITLSSPLKRAFHTAQLVAEAFGSGSEVGICKDLLPGTPAKRTQSAISEFADVRRVLIVGHEPDLGLLASVLIGAAGPAIEFKKGALCRIDIEDPMRNGTGVLLWHLQPKHLRSLGKSK